MFKFLVGLLAFGYFPSILAGKDKSVKKKPIAVTDPLGLRTLEDWLNLGEVVLKKSCLAVKIPMSGSAVTMARRLLNYYRRLGASSTTTVSGKRVTFISVFSMVGCAEVTIGSR